MQKKVLVFVPEFPVVTETFIARELSALAGIRQLDIQILAMRRGRGEVPQNLKTLTHFRKVSILDILRGKATFMASPSKWMRAYKAVGFTRPYLFLKTLGYASMFSRFQPDIIYAHFLSVPSTIALGASILLDVPLGISAHARDVLEYPDRAQEKTHLAKFIAVCNKNAFSKLKGKNVHLLYHGINPEDLNGSGNMPDTPMILCLARYVEKKGLEYLIEAAKTLKDSGQQFSMNLVGGGPLQSDLTKKVSDLGLQNEVFLLGEKPFDVVRELMHSASVYVQPSIDAVGGDSDGVPNALIEAAMIGVPIVTTDAGSIRDFLSEDNSILVPQRDPGELANGMIKLLDNKKLGGKLSAHAKTTALEVFNMQENIGKLSKLILRAAK